jgi:hypothetical protein
MTHKHLGTLRTFRRRGNEKVRFRRVWTRGIKYHNRFILLHR